MFLICQAQEQLFNTTVAPYENQCPGPRVQVAQASDSTISNAEMDALNHLTLSYPDTQLIALIPVLILPTYLPITNLTSHIDLPTGRDGTDQQT